MTCRGSKILEAIIKPIPYKNRNLEKTIETKTLKEFEVSNSDFQNKLYNHKNDHIS